MEKLDIISGSGKVTTEKVNVLLELAMKYFGIKYEDTVLNTLKSIYFYELQGNEKLHEVVAKLLRKRVDSVISANLFSPNANALYICNVITNDKFVIYKPTGEDLDYHLLAHELFGHAVCSYEKPIVMEDRVMYYRNGLQLSSILNNQILYNAINEGFMEHIASSIIKGNNRGINDTISRAYANAKYSADFITNILGEENVLDSLILTQGSIEKEFNKESNKNEFMILNKLLDEEMKSENPVLVAEIGKQLVKFQGRQKV